jgi:hypothetical protein
VCRGTGVRPARRGNMGAYGDTKANGGTQTALRHRGMIRGVTQSAVGLSRRSIATED